MDMEKKVWTLFAVFSLIVLAGCQQQASTSTTKTFVGGNTGLTISFLQGSPPDEVFDVNSPFNVGIRLENTGEWDITDANKVEVSITGILPSNFGLSSGQLVMKSPEPLKGVSFDASQNVVKGDSVDVEFPTMNYYAATVGTIPYTIRANVCYEYGTNVQGKLCVRKDLRGVSGQTGFCNPNRDVAIENSGAPVQITAMQQSVSGSNKIDIFFTIKNEGASGDTLHRTGTDCDSLSSSNRNVVYVDVKSTGLGDMTCSGLTGGTKTAGFIALDATTGTRDIRCTQTVDNLIDFETPINIQLTYGFKQFVDKQILVKHSPT